MTWPQIRERIDSAEPVVRDIAAAVEAARELRDPSWNASQRDAWYRIMADSIFIAESGASWWGPQLVRSAVERHARDRAAAADCFAGSMSERMMALAGFTREDFEMSDDEIRELVEKEIGEYFKQLRVRTYEAMGLPIPEDEE